ncbi:MAG: hypothetical protein WDM77_16390 [Steroidobacteraceae bacterium]
MKPNVRITLQTLLKNGTSQREIERVTGVDRKTIRRYAPGGKLPPGVATGSGAYKYLGRHGGNIATNEYTACFSCKNIGFNSRAFSRYADNSWQTSG